MDIKKVQIGTKDNYKILDKWQNLHPRRSNWENCESTVENGINILKTLSHGRYSRSCSYERKSYQPLITSYAYIQDDHLVYTFGTKTIKLHQPKGCKWSYDDQLNLFCLSNQKGEIHLNSDDLNNYSKRKIQKSLAEVYESRKAIKKEKANKALALTANIFVSVQDAYKAGSCKAGVLSCLNSQKLKGSHFRIKTINRIFGWRYKYHIDRLIAVAIDRHKLEEKQGFCVI